MPKSGHQPQVDAAVQSAQDVRTVHSSEPGGAGGGGGGVEPLAKDVQLKTDRTGSVVQIESLTPQLLLMVLKRALEVTYWRDPADVVGMMLQPNDRVAVPSFALSKEISTA